MRKKAETRNVPITSLENSVLELYGLDQNAVESLSSTNLGDLVIINVTLKPDYPPCPRCGHEHPNVCNYVDKTITHSILHNCRCQINYHARRYKCPVCNRTWYEFNPFVFKKQRISVSTVVCVLEEMRDPAVTFTSVAKRYNLSPTTVQHIFDDHVQIPKATTLPRVLQLDETYSFKSGTSVYVCMLLDYDTQTAVDLLPSRKKQDLIDFFSSFPLEERQKVRFIAADMYETYRVVCKKFFPDAIYACDRFHVMQEFNRRLTEVRIRTMKGTLKGSDEYYLLKHQNHLLGIKPNAKKRIKNPDPYSKKKKDIWVNVFDPNGERTCNAHFKTWLNEYELRELLLSISDDLTEAYEMRNTLSEFFRNGTKVDAADRLQVILADLNRSQVKELNAFGQTVVNWFREIVNSFEIVKTEYVVDKKNGKARRKDHRLTSSMIENRNKLVKQIKNNANGYTNWKRFRNRVLYVLNRPAFRLEPFEKEDKGT